MDPGRARDDAGQFLDMAIANSQDLRRNLTPLQEADALFAASQAGATRARIRKATGRTATEVKAALRAGRLSEGTRELAGELPRQPSLDELALLAEFERDELATRRLLSAISFGHSVDHVAEQIRQDHAEKTKHDQLVTELTAAGITITDTLPDGARPLDMLTHDGQDLTPDNHARCPGRSAYFRPWSPLEPCWYCTSPAANGHTDRYPSAPVSSGPGSPPDPGSPDGLRGSLPEQVSDPSRKLVLEGNKAWAAAAQVRQRWLRGLLARRTAPPQAARFIARQLLVMPEPLRACLVSAANTTRFTELTGQQPGQVLEACGTATAGRLPLLMLAPVLTAYEHEISADDPERRCTWRQDRYAPCPRDEAGAYLEFLASLGYQLSAIEQAVADGTAYTGPASASGPLPGSAAASPVHEPPPGEGATRATEPAGDSSQSADDAHAGTKTQTAA